MSRLAETAQSLVAHCRARTEQQGLADLYAPDAVSVESGPSPDGAAAETVGLDGIHGKHVWWDETFEVHASSADGPYLHGADRFAVIFEAEFRERASGQRGRMKEVAVYTVNDAGKIVREEFFAAL